MRERVIETTQITKKYGKVLALDHVDICVKRGDIYGLIGDNGAGKSTLLKLLAGHSAASTGEIRLFGEQGEKELQRARRRSGVMIEQPGFFGNLTVENNMEYYRIQKGVPGKEKVEEIVKSLSEGEAVKSGTKKITPKRAKLPEEFNMLKQHLSGFFNTKVQLTCSEKGKGKISIPFSNEEELERIMEIFDSLKK